MPPTPNYSSAVQVLGVKHVIVCGHTNCGAIKAALTLPTSSPLLTSGWISRIRDTRDVNAAELAGLPLKEQIAKLTQLNVGKQVVNVCTSPVVQQAWLAGAEVHVHGLLYDVATGALSRLTGPISAPAAAPTTAAVALSASVAESAFAQAPTQAEAVQRYAAMLSNDSPAAHVPVGGTLLRRRLSGASSLRNTEQVVRVSESGAVVRRRPASMDMSPDAQQRGPDSGMPARQRSSTAALPPDIFMRRLAPSAALGDAGGEGVAGKSEADGDAAGSLRMEGIAKRLRSVPTAHLDIERCVATRLAQHAAFEAAAAAQ